MERPRILAELKSQTRPQHDSVEQNRFGKAMMDGTLSQEDYRLFLQKFYGFHVPLEQVLSGFPWDSVGINFDERRKVALLSHDLKALGLSDADIVALPLAETLPAMNTLEEAMGVMYVMEGSTLGGQIQSRQVQKMFGFDAENGAAYFSSYGANVGAMWKACCEAIVKVADDNLAKEDVIIASAQRTFAALEEWLALEVEELV
ncbi:MAG: biliverdin-producing heme oxygenase [Candidatus Kapabacteria bacterium]|jgi:heme oxygenase|nr:biliverdin-producing heme oxygenase [Candidatus Kapabacteria bacterium]